VCFDLKALLNYCLPKDTTRPATVDWQDLNSERFFDCQLAAYLLDSTRTPNSLLELLDKNPEARREPQATTTPQATATQQATTTQQATATPQAATTPQATATTPQTAKKDHPTIASSEDLTIPEIAVLAASLLSLQAILAQRLDQEAATTCFQQIEMPLVKVLAQMERVGVHLQLSTLKSINETLTSELESLRQQALAAAGQDFNLDSPKQLAEVLFDKLKLPAMKKTKSGYSTDASVLEELKNLHPLPSLMLEYRELAKLKSTYLDALPRLVAPDGNIHTTFNQAVTATGRLSSADPNLQNIPVRRQIGRQIRQAFVPNAKALGVSDALLLGADYSQIELRLLAHLSEDKGLIQAFRAGQDFHTMTAAQVWTVAPDAVTADLRSRAKAVNFGIVYGQQAFGLAQSLGVSFPEAQAMIDRYFQTFPGVKEYLDKTVAKAHQQGWVDTIFGRRRYIHELYSSNVNQRHFGERTAMNHPMQGSAADIIKLAMIEVSERLIQDGFKSQLILQVHDELVFNCATDETQALTTLVKQVMEGVVELKVPMLVEVATGENWAEAH
jgi:DNA polymerase-1